MDMDVGEQGRMIRDLVAKFVRSELMPLEPEYLQRLAKGVTPALPPERTEHLRKVSKELGLWGLDAPVDMGGYDLPGSVMALVAEEMAKTPVPFRLPPDSPNLRMLQAVGTPAQKEKYLQPYIDGEVTSALAVSEPGAGGDSAALETRAERVGDEWVLNGRKIWITNAAQAAFVITMARVGDSKRREGITAFIIEKGTPGFIVEREVPMIGGRFTYEILLDNCRLPAGALLGEVGRGYDAMQIRLRTRRLEMGSTAIGITHRALEVMMEHVKLRSTFGVKLADRQAIQWWIADTSIQLHACRLMVQDAARKVDRGETAQHEISMIKVLSTELAYNTVDHAMQALGALGLTQETVLFAMWQQARMMRMYEGPSEVHRQAVARRVLADGPGSLSPAG